MVGTGVTAGAALLAKEAVAAIDSSMKPTYVNGGTAEPAPVEQPLWQPRTNWRVTIIDGRNGKKTP